MSSMSVILHWLVIVQAAGLIGIGLGAFVAPAFGAKGYGLPTQDAVALAFMRGIGVRDISLGLSIIAVELLHSPAIGWVMLAVSPVAFSDLLTTSRLEAPWASRIPHLLGGALLLGTAIMLLV